MINQKIVEDIDFNEMSIDAQFLFMRTIPFLDRDGLVWGHPGLLSSKIVPLLPAFSAKVGPAIDEWIRAEFVTRYMDGRTPVLHFRGFNKNQSLTHYDRESASTFAPPPGFNRTSKGLKPLSDDDGGTPELPKEPKNSPPSSVGNTPDLLRTNSGPTPDYIPTNGIEEKGIEEKEKDTHATPTMPEASQYNPSLSQILHRSTDRTKTAEHVKEAKALGLTPAQFRENTDALLEGFGKKALVDAGDDIALNHAQELTLIVARMSEKFRTVEGINRIFDSWTKNDYRGDSVPSSPQYKEHASLMVSGKVVCTRKTPATGANGATQPKPPLDFKKWLLDTYRVDNPKFIDIPKAVLDERYNTYRSQQAH